MSTIVTRAGKASVPDEDFNSAINQAIQSVQSDTKKGNKKS